MRRLVYLAAAERDLLSILDYIARECGSAAIGLAFTERLQASAPGWPRCPARSAALGRTSAASPSETT